MIRDEIPSELKFDITGIVLNFFDFDIELFHFHYETRCESFHGNYDEFHHIIFFQNGNVDVTYQDRILHIEPGTYMYFPPNHIHSETVLETDVIRYQLSFGVFKNKQCDKPLGKVKNNTLPRLESSELFEALFKNKIFEIDSVSSNSESLFEKIVTELNSMLFGHRYKLTLLFYEFFIDIYRELNNSSLDNINTRYFPSSKLTPLILYRYLFNNVKTATLESVAKDFVLSKRSIQRYIKSAYNTSFVTFLNRIKIEVAKELIQTTDLSITKISQEVGYHSKSYFNKIFMKHEKMTAAEYKIDLKE